MDMLCLKTQRDEYHIVNTLQVTTTRATITTTTTRQEKQMKALTAKQATMTVTIKLGNDIESFFFYDSRSYTEVINAINSAQRQEGN